MSGALMIPDASVLINVLATPISSELLSLSSSVQIVDYVYTEITRCPRRGRPRVTALASLIESGTCQRVTPGAEELKVAIGLMSGHDSIGDGEAFAIARAVQFGGTVALDDRKARRICGTRHPLVPIVSSVDLFRALETTGLVSSSRLADALERALIDTRMHVAASDVPWLRGLLPDDTIRRCPSLRVQDRR